MRCRARPRLTRHFQDNHGRSRAALTSTRQVGTGTQSSYSVPTTYGGAESAGSGSSYGVTGSSNVNVTRYGSEGDSSAGFTSFERDMTSQTQQIAAASALNIKQGGLGFDTGGQIAPGGTQHVEFFKNPNERLIIARPDQFNDVRSQPSTEKTAANDIRPIVINQNHNWNGNAPPSKDSVAEMRRQTAQAVQDAMRAYRGR